MKAAGILNRERISNALKAAYDYPLTVLEAPMGFGKTTAVRMFLETEKIDSVFIACRSFQDTSAVFWDRFVNEVSKIGNQVGQALKSVGFPADPPQLEKFILLLEQVTFECRKIFVIDDYQLAHDIKLNNLILLLAKEEIENLHIILITRDTTDIGFAELLAKGLCTVLSRYELKFTPEEITAYCRLTDDKISKTDIDRLYEYTDGWISFVYIMLIGLRQGIPVGMTTTVEDLIETALFRGYDDQTRAFLLKLSVMDDFTAKQAEYVLQNENTEEALKSLNRENAFVYYDEKTKTYKIHNVLLDFLRQKQSFPENVLKELHARLGEWHLQSNEHMTAYSYLYKTGQTRRIFECLNDPRNIRDALTQFDGADELFAITPRETLFAYPFAYLQHIFLSLVYSDTANKREWTERLDELEQYYESKIYIDKSTKNRILGEILIIRKFTLFNHLEQIKESNNEIIRLLDGRNSYIALQENVFTFGSPHYLYLYYRDKGSFKSIADILSLEVGYAKFSNGCGTGCDSLALAEYALETGDFEHVKINCEQARVKAESKAQSAVAICAGFAQIRLLLLNGEISEATDILDKLEKKAETLHDALINTTFDLCKGYVYACMLQTEKIPVWLQTGNMSSAYMLYEGAAFNYLVYGKAVMAAKHYAELEALTEQFDGYFSIYSNRLGFIHNGIFRAVARFRLYGMEAGLPALKNVIREAAADGIIMPFIEAAGDLLEMLQLVCNLEPDNGFAATMLRYAKIYSGNMNGIYRNTTSLSDREIEILALLDKGLSRKQIAEHLCISQETAKTHLKNIYQKLDAGGKMAAIHIAKIRGYLEKY
jgi:ATP-dependent transcriptional regulator